MATKKKSKKSPAARAARPASKSTKPPAIGAKWQGGIYAGVTLHDDKAMHLVLLPGDKKLPWADAVAWATKEKAELPSRIDSLVLLKNLKDKFQRDWYWTGEQHAADSDYAWIQVFGWGNQDDVPKSLDFRARLVRRFPI